MNKNNELLQSLLCAIDKEVESNVIRKKPEGRSSVVQMWVDTVVRQNVYVDMFECVDYILNSKAPDGEKPFCWNDVVNYFPGKGKIQRWIEINPGLAIELRELNEIILMCDNHAFWGLLSNEWPWSIDREFWELLFCKMVLKIDITTYMEIKKKNENILKQTANDLIEKNEETYRGDMDDYEKGYYEGYHDAMVNLLNEIGIENYELFYRV